MRDILHCDLNNFYASVECLENPCLKNSPVAVCGDEKDRKGIVLAKNYIAKSFGIKTGLTIFQAKQLCPNIVIKTANFPLYIKYSKIVKSIYLEYTNLVESFGIDEAWLDVTHSKMFGSPFQIASLIKERIKKEVGLTISVGVSFNKIFAKLGSDLKKPDAITQITPSNYKEIVWKLPAEALVGIGNATLKKLNNFGLYTIGDVANCSRDFLMKKLGKWGLYLHQFSNGEDVCKVDDFYAEKKIKSIGNSTTFYRDLTNNQEVIMGLTPLCESVAKRLKQSKIARAKTLCLKIKDCNLNSISKQCKLLSKTENSTNIINCAFNLFKQIYNWEYPVRALSVSVKDFSKNFEQLNFLETNKNGALDTTINKLREKFGENIIFRANRLYDKKIGGIVCNNVHPISFFH